MECDSRSEQDARPLFVAVLGASSIVLIPGDALPQPHNIGAVLLLPFALPGNDLDPFEQHRHGLRSASARHQAGFRSHLKGGFWCGSEYQGTTSHEPPRPDPHFGTDGEMLAWCRREGLEPVRDEDGHWDWPAARAEFLAQSELAG